MTDLPPEGTSIPSRLGVTLTVDGDSLTGHLHPRPEICAHGVVRASAVAFLADVVAGLAVDTDPGAWTFTADLSLRLPAVPAPAQICADAEILRAGQRSLTSSVNLQLADGSPLGYSVLGFARVRRKPDDPPKPEIDLDLAAAFWSEVSPLDLPLRDAAGVTPLDPATGAVSLEVRPDLLNPAGALQGAMVALAVEAAAEDLANHHCGPPAGPPQVVTELDIRFLAQAREAPVVSRARFIGPSDEGSIHVELRDRDSGRLLTSALAGTKTAPSLGPGVGEPVPSDELR